jgi:hypothetical protein
MGSNRQASSSLDYHHSDLCRDGSGYLLDNVFARVLIAIAVIRISETQRNSKRVIAVVQVQMRYSEVLFAPLRLKQKNRRTKFEKSCFVEQ